MSKVELHTSFHEAKAKSKFFLLAALYTIQGLLGHICLESKDSAEMVQITLEGCSQRSPTRYFVDGQGFSVVSFGQNSINQLEYV